MFRRCFRGALDGLDGIDKVAAEWAEPTGRAVVFAGAFGLGFIGENHFPDGFATGDGGIKDGHGKLPFGVYQLI